jgi:hypothetical protein
MVRSKAIRFRKPRKSIEDSARILFALSNHRSPLAIKPSQVTDNTSKEILQEPLINGQCDGVEKENVASRHIDKTQQESRCKHDRIDDTMVEMDIAFQLLTLSHKPQLAEAKRTVSFNTLVQVREYDRCLGDACEKAKQPLGKKLQYALTIDYTIRTTSFVPLKDEHMTKAKKELSGLTVEDRCRILADAMGDEALAAAIGAQRRMTSDKTILTLGKKLKGFLAGSLSQPP